MQGRPRKLKIKRVTVFCDGITQVFDFSSNKDFIASQELNSIDKNIIVEKIRNKSTPATSESINKIQDQNKLTNFNMPNFNSNQIKATPNKTLDINKNSLQSSDENIFKLSNDFQYFNNDEIGFENSELEDDNIIDLLFSDWD